jgi:peptide chain release factor
MWIQITAGQGPVECSRAVWHIVQMIQQECDGHDVAIELISSEADREKNSLKSALLKVADSTDNWLIGWEGTVCWHASSPFRPHHKRKNWYVRISFFKATEETVFDSSQINIEALKGSGPGGQHVNKSCTAIRATYIPLNISVFCHEERSQLMNKKLAMARLHKLIGDVNRQSLDDIRQEKWISHYRLTRGDFVKKITKKL